MSPCYQNNAVSLFTWYSEDRKLFQPLTQIHYGFQLVQDTLSLPGNEFIVFSKLHFAHTHATLPKQNQQLQQEKECQLQEDI